MHDRQKQVKYQVFYHLILEKKPYLHSRIWLQSTQTLILRDAPRHTSSFQLTAAPPFPTDQAEEFPSTDSSHLTPTPCCRVWFCFQKASHSSFFRTNSVSTRPSCTEEGGLHIHPRGTHHERPNFEVACERVSPWGFCAHSFTNAELQV